MLKSFVKKNWHIIICNTILLLIFIIGYGRFGHSIVDSFREAYIPEQIIKGQALYKNIFTIYPPGGYLINALLFFIFGAKLKVLYAASFAATAGIINITYKIASKFLPRLYSAAIVLFIISAAVLSPNAFNLLFPYSYGILYGLFFVLLAINCSIRKQFFGAYLLYSLAICCKYEFIFFLPLLVWYSGKKNILKNCTAFLIPIFLTICTLYLQGVQYNNILTSLQWMFAMYSSKTLYWFYSASGLVFRPQLIPIYLSNILKYLIPLLLIRYFNKIWVIAIIAIYLWYFINPEILIYTFPLILILGIIKLKTLNTKKKFFIASTLLISMKLFFALTLESYGVYFLPFAIISLFILTQKKFKKPLFILLILCSMIIGIKNSISIADRTQKIQTEKGVFYDNNLYGKTIKNTIQYIKINTKPTDKVLVLPEGLIINFLTGRDSDNKFYSLLPLYTEMYGEDLIIKRLEFEKPEYIIISNYDTSNYYYSYFGQDYAGKVFEHILQNYKLDALIGDRFIMNIFKRKN